LLKLFYVAGKTGVVLFQCERYQNWGIQEGYRKLVYIPNSSNGLEYRHIYQGHTCYRSTKPG